MGVGAFQIGALDAALCALYAGTGTTQMQLSLLL